MQRLIHGRAGEETVLTIEREGVTRELSIVPGSVEIEGRTVGQIGVMPTGIRTAGRPVGEAVLGGIGLTWEWNGRIIGALRNIFTPEVELQGPVGIIRETNRAAEEGIVPLFILVAVISVHLALFNLLPIPALDGGRLVFLLAEVVRRKPVNARIELAVHAVGFLFLLGLIIVVTFKDVGRIWGGS
jgi:regulator of sigma E protease